MYHDDVQMIIGVHVADEMVWQPRWRISFRILNLEVRGKIVDPAECFGVQARELRIRSPVLLLLDLTVGVMKMPDIANITDQV